MSTRSTGCRQQPPRLGIVLIARERPLSSTTQAEARKACNVSALSIPACPAQLQRLDGEGDLVCGRALIVEINQGVEGDARVGHPQHPLAIVSDGGWIVLQG